MRCADAAAQMMWIDASVALTGRRHRGVVLTSDAADLRQLDPGLEVVGV